MTKILLVDDDQNFLENVSELLTLHGFVADTAVSVAEGKRKASATLYDVLLLDLMLDDGSGLQVLEVCSKATPMPRVAIVTGHPVIKTMVSNLYGPGVQYLLKPLDIDVLIKFIEGNTSNEPEVNHTAVSATAANLPANSTAEPGKLAETAAAMSGSGANRARHADQPNLHFDVLLGESPAMQALYHAIASVANTKANVLIQGESGAGKELVAKAIHHASAYQGPFVAANCGALSRELISSELFGHEKGAFTGAVGRKAGLFEQAHGGTLFLDEVTEMPIDLQPNLLRVLETKKVVRVGGREEIPVDCRVISATNRTTDEFAEGNILREDLFYRLAVFPIELAPLRERKEDIPLIAGAFLAKLNEENRQQYKLSDQHIRQLSEYDWPGNVRELRHTIHRAFILTNPDSVYINLPSNIASPFANKNRQGQVGSQFGSTIEEMEQDLILTTLARLNGDKPKAAEMLGISLKTLYNRLNSYEQLMDT